MVSTVTICVGMGGVGIGTPFVADQRPRTLLEHARGRLCQMIEPVKRSMAVRSLDYEVQMKRKGSQYLDGDKVVKGSIIIALYYLVPI